MGQTSSGGGREEGGGRGEALVGKWGQVLDGGIDQIFANWGVTPPPVPHQGKNPAQKKNNSMSKREFQKGDQWAGSHPQCSGSTFNIVMS